jgi:hypothetical protein
MKECMLEKSWCCSSGHSAPSYKRLKLDFASEDGGVGSSGRDEDVDEDETACEAAPPPAAGGADAATAAEVGAGDNTANAFKNLIALPVANPTFTRSSFVKSPMTSSSNSCEKKEY